MHNEMFVIVSWVINEYPTTLGDQCSQPGHVCHDVLEVETFLDSVLFPEGIPYMAPGPSIRRRRAQGGNVCRRNGIQPGGP